MIIYGGKTAHDPGHRSDIGFRPLTLYVTLDIPGAVREPHQTAKDMLRLTVTLNMIPLNVKGREIEIGADGLLIREGIIPVARVNEVFILRMFYPCIWG
jgi:hypothetical protein